MIALLTIPAYLSFKVSKCYRKNMKFALSYVFLGVMFVSYGVAEIVYLFQGLFGVQHFPSFEDIGYGLFYVFGILFVVHQLSFYAIKPIFLNKLISFSVGGIIFLIYLIFSYNYDNLVEFGVASISMGLAATLFALTLFTVLTLKKSKRYREWIMVSIAIGTYTIADLHYYITENISDFSYSDPSNYGWIIAPIIFIYILVKLNIHPNNSV